MRLPAPIPVKNFESLVSGQIRFSPVGAEGLEPPTFAL